MPVSEDSEQEIPGQSLAVWAEVLYLEQPAVAPGLAFVVLLWLYFKRSADTPALAALPPAPDHQRQPLGRRPAGDRQRSPSSCWAAMPRLKPGSSSIIYFTTCHSTLVLLGVLGLAKAMAGQEICLSAGRKAL